MQKHVASFACLGLAGPEKRQNKNWTKKTPLFPFFFFLDRNVLFSLIEDKDVVMKALERTSSDSRT